MSQVIHRDRKDVTVNTPRQERCHMCSDSISIMNGWRFGFLSGRQTSIQMVMYMWNPTSLVGTLFEAIRSECGIQEVSIDSRSINRFTLVEENLRDYWYQPTRDHQQEHHWSNEQEGIWIAKVQSRKEHTKESFLRKKLSNRATRLLRWYLICMASTRLLRCSTLVLQGTKENDHVNSVTREVIE